MFHRIVRTSGDLAPCIARLALGLVMFPHGAQKALGWFGGSGIQATVGFFGTQGIPAALALLVIAAEFLGSIGLVAGFLGRVAAAGIAVVMAVAAAAVHAPNGFFANWTGQQKGEGFEYHLLAIGLALVVIVSGSGAFSVDRALSKSAGAPQAA